MKISSGMVVHEAARVKAKWDWEWEWEWRLTEMQIKEGAHEQVTHFGFGCLGSIRVLGVAAAAAIRRDGHGDMDQEDGLALDGMAWHDMGIWASDWIGRGVNMWCFTVTVLQLLFTSTL